MMRSRRWLSWSATAALVLGAALSQDMQDAAEVTGSPFREGDRVPDLEVLPPGDFYVADTRAEGGTVRLKFSTTIWNAGEGPMEVWGDADGEDLRVRQVVHVADGSPRPVRPVGGFDFDHRHGHLHLTAFARYELWRLEGGTPAALVAENDKVGFCLMDNLVVDEALAAEDPAYAGCDADVQGISPGWGDLYVAQLFEQDIVIEGLPDGPYRVVNIANPDGALAEASHDNNASHTDVILRDGRVSLLMDD